MIIVKEILKWSIRNDKDPIGIPIRECRDIETIDSGTARRKTVGFLVTFPSKNAIRSGTEMQSML